MKNNAMTNALAYLTEASATKKERFLKILHQATTFATSSDALLHLKVTNALAYCTIVLVNVKREKRSSLFLSEC